VSSSDKNDKRHHFKELKCWQASRELRKMLYKIANKLPDREKYALGSQLRRCAVSITANIAEGYGRYHYKENIQFCRQGRASMYEAEDLIITCKDENYIDEATYSDTISRMVEARKLLDGYIRYLSKELKTIGDT
jgi:four helix bundle protein